jgi:hypothetical protein
MTLADQFRGVGASDDESADELASDGLPPAPLQDPQDFEDYWSEELVILYHALIDRSAGSGWRLFENLDFCDFCKFAYDKSSRHKEPWND